MVDSFLLVVVNTGNAVVQKQLLVIGRISSIVIVDFNQKYRFWSEFIMLIVFYKTYTFIP